MGTDANCCRSSVGGSGFDTGSGLGYERGNQTARKRVGSAPTSLTPDSVHAPFGAVANGSSTLRSAFIPGGRMRHPVPPDRDPELRRAFALDKAAQIALLTSL